MDFDFTDDQKELRAAVAELAQQELNEGLRERERNGQFNRAGWDKLAGPALPLMRKIIEEHYPPGGTIIRAMAAKLVAGGRITPHFDAHQSFRFGHRIHIPITTNAGVRFMIDGRPYQFEIGKGYEINNQKTHSVMNRGKEDRVTFIFDYVPPKHIDPAKRQADIV